MSSIEKGLVCTRELGKMERLNTHSQCVKIGWGEHAVNSLNVCIKIPHTHQRY